MLSVTAVLVQKRVQFVSACCCIAGYVHKMDRPTVWSRNGSTFYKSWNTTLYYNNEAYVCGFVGMEVNKEKAFEVWHRRPDLDWPIPENNGVAMESPTMKMMAMIPDEKPMAMIPQEGRWTKKMEKQLTTAMKSPAMKSVKKPMKRSK